MCLTRHTTKAHYNTHAISIGICIDPSLRTYIHKTLLKTYDPLEIYIHKTLCLRYILARPKHMYTCGISVSILTDFHELLI